jgi:hypothetical protein
MKPCDCLDINDAGKLKEQGIGYNDWSIRVEPSVVIITTATVTLKIPQVYFGRFANWYIADQN